MFFTHYMEELATVCGRYDHTCNIITVSATVLNLWL